MDTNITILVLSIPRSNILFFPTNLRHTPHGIPFDINAYKTMLINKIVRA